MGGGCCLLGSPPPLFAAGMGYFQAALRQQASNLQATFGPVDSRLLE